MNKRFWMVAPVVSVVCMSVAPAMAQTLADRVPADALAYVGWRGTKDPGGGYDESRFKAVIESSKIREFVNDFGPKLATKVGEKDARSGRQIRVASDLLTSTLKYPTAFFFSGISGEGRNAMPKFGVLCQAGADAPALQTKIQTALTEAGALDGPVSSRVSGDLVILTFGYDDPAVVGGLDKMVKLRQRDNFSSAMTQVKADTSWVSGYVDVAGVLSLIKSQIPREQDSAMFTKIIEAVGVSGVRQVAFASGFDGRDWMNRSFVEAPAPRTGLLALCDDAKLSDATLKLIPADATFALAGNADFAGFIKATRVAVEKVDPEAAKMFDRGVGGVTMALGKQLVPDLLEPLGREWAVYNSPTVAGTGLTGLVVVNKLDDPVKLKASLPQASISLSNWLAIALSKGGNKELTVAGQSTKVDGRNVYYLGLPFVSPSWTIAGDTLYTGLYTQATISGARQGDKKAPAGSILDNPKYVALQKRLNVEKPASVSFYDLPVSVPTGGNYQQWLFVTGYAGFGDLLGVPVQQPLFPPFDVVVQNLAPAGSASWTDAAGLHGVSVSPFPGSMILSEQGSLSTVGVGGGALMTSILLPSLNRARETANRVKCASNLRTMGQGMLLFANEHKFKYPADIGELAEYIATEDSPLTALSVFTCPSGETTLPPNAANFTPKQVGEWVSKNADYVYLGAGKTTSADAEEIMMYEKPHAHGGDGMNMLYGDGHVEFQIHNTAEAEINRAHKPQGGGL